MFGRGKTAASDGVIIRAFGFDEDEVALALPRDSSATAAYSARRPRVVPCRPARPRAPPKPRAENMFSKYRRCSRPETTACHRMSGIAYAVCSKGRRCSASVRSCVKGCWHGLIMRVARSQDAAVWCHFVSLLRRTDVESPL